MIRYLLTLFALMLVMYALREWKRSRFISAGLMLLAVLGVAFVWFPGVGNDVAHAIGVGRAADMVFYSYTALSFLMILNLALKQREQHQEITRLARYIAKATARQESPDAPAGTDAKD